VQTGPLPPRRMLLILRRYGDFAHESFGAPLETHFSLQLANHAFQHPGAEALTRRRLDERAVRLGPAEDEASLCRTRPFDVNVPFGCRQRPILRRVGGQLMQAHRNRLGGNRLQ
jgi:hypothetical protein